MSEFHDIMVVLDGTARSEVRLAIAIDLARRNDAHIIGVSALCLLMPPNAPTLGMLYPELPLSPSRFGSLNGVGAAQTEAAPQPFGERAEQIEAEFRQVLRSHGLRGEFQLTAGKSSEALTGPARQADLIILGQFDPNNPPPRAGRQLVQDILMAAGRPVLVVPYAGRFETIGTRVLVGWNGSRAAARAVHDAMPLLAGASTVVILQAYSTGRAQSIKDATGLDLSSHLAHHGIKAEISRTVINGISAANALLSFATDISADLLIVGGSCHSRPWEFLLGGVTRGLLHDMTLPAFMSH